MAISSRFRRLIYDAVKFGVAVWEDQFSETQQALNALYESLWSDTPPGISTQTIWGHNHATPPDVFGSAGGAGGGGGLCRGLVLGASGGNTALWSMSPSTAMTPTYISPGGMFAQLGKCPISQGLDRNKYLIASVLYSAQNSDFFLDVSEVSQESRGISAANNPVRNELPQTYADTEDESKTWVFVRLPLAPGRGQAQFYPSGLAKTYDSSNAPVLNIYEIQVWEIDGLSTTRIGQRLDALQ